MLKEGINPKIRVHQDEEGLEKSQETLTLRMIRLQLRLRRPLPSRADVFVVKLLCNSVSGVTFWFHENWGECSYLGDSGPIFCETGTLFPISVKPAGHHRHYYK